jgi:hypothetical protein
MFGSKPKCVTPGGPRHCTNANCPERKAFYAMMSGSVDPYLGAELPVAFKGQHIVLETLNVANPSDNGGYGIIKATGKFHRINRRARGRYAIVWNSERNVERQAREHREWVNHFLLTNFVVRGKPTVKEMRRIQKIATAAFGTHCFFISQATSAKKSPAPVADFAAAR